jgi:hypothetical protein
MGKTNKRMGKRMGKTKRTKKGGSAFLPDSLRQIFPAYMRHSTLSQIKEKLAKKQSIQPWEVGFDTLREWKRSPEKYNFSPQDLIELDKVYNTKIEEGSTKLRPDLDQARENRQQYTPILIEHQVGIGGKTRRRKGRKSRRSRK